MNMNGGVCNPITEVVPYPFMSLCLLLLFPFHLISSEYAWSYSEDEFGGPNFWGLVDKQWEMCAKGKLQSPVDILPQQLLFDPSLRPFHVDRVTVASELVNTGQMPRVRIGNSMRRPPATLSGGPLNTYRYRVQRIDIHYGRDESRLNGSEHCISGKKFPMEIQLLAFNSDLYDNLTAASKSPNGIAALSVLVDIGSITNEELLKLTTATSSIIYKNKRVELADLKPWALLPYTRDYVTYEGSMTSPGCYETVTWIILNQPIHITVDHLNDWMKMQQTKDSSEDDLYLAPNSRGIKALNGRLLRTNIQHKTTSLHNSRECRLPMTSLSYRSNVGKRRYEEFTSLSHPVSMSRYNETYHKKRHDHKYNAYDYNLFA